MSPAVLASGVGAVAALISSIVALFKGTGGSAGVQAAAVTAGPFLFAVWVWVVHWLEATKTGHSASVAVAKITAATPAGPPAGDLAGLAQALLSGGGPPAAADRPAGFGAAVEAEIERRVAAELAAQGLPATLPPHPTS